MVGKFPGLGIREETHASEKVSDRFGAGRMAVCGGRVMAVAVVMGFLCGVFMGQVASANAAPQMVRTENTSSSIRYS